MVRTYFHDMTLILIPKCLYIPQVSCVKCQLMKSKKSQLKPHPTIGHKFLTIKARQP